MQEDYFEGDEVIVAEQEKEGLVESSAPEPEVKDEESNSGKNASEMQKDLVKNEEESCHEDVCVKDYCEDVADADQEEDGMVEDSPSKSIKEEPDAEMCE